MSDGRASHASRSPPTTRRSPATSPAGRCCRASRCSPRCSRRRSPSRALAACDRRRAAPGGRQVPRAGRARARRSRSRFRARRARIARMARSATAPRSSPAARSRAPTVAGGARHEGRRRHRAADRLDAPARAQQPLAAARRCAALAIDRRPARDARCCSIRSSAVHPRSRETRHHSARYLARALGRPATWGDVYRHLHTFAATVLDRVYLLQERFDLFRFEASGVEAILEPFAQRRRRARVRRPPRQLRGAAHDRPREGPARGDDHVRGQRAPDQRDARGDRAATPSCTRSRSAGSTRCSRSGAGSTTAASPACSPTARLPRQLRSARRRSRCPSSARRRASPTGRSASPRCCAGKVVFMAGLYRGGKRLRSALHRARRLRDLPAPVGARPSATRRSRAALQRYVATLEALCREAPYNWFNFYDFWADDERRPRRAMRLSAARFVAATSLRARPRRAPRSRRARRSRGLRPRRADHAARPRQVGRGDLRRDAPRSRCSTARSQSSGRLVVQGARHASSARR